MRPWTVALFVGYLTAVAGWIAASRVAPDLWRPSDTAAVSTAMARGRVRASCRRRSASSGTALGTGRPIAGRGTTRAVRREPESAADLLADTPAALGAWPVLRNGAGAERSSVHPHRGRRGARGHRPGRTRRRTAPHGRWGSARAARAAPRERGRSFSGVVRGRRGAILLVRLAAAIGTRPAVVAAASLFAAGHIPSMLARGASLTELAALVRDVTLGLVVLGTVLRSRDILWFWPVHVTMDLTQFARVMGTAH